MKKAAFLGSLMVLVLTVSLFSGVVSVAEEIPYVCIDLEKTGPATAVPGETITYHYEVSNCGQIWLLSGYQVYDPLINPTSDYRIWEGELAPMNQEGDKEEFDKEYTIPLDFCGELTNHAWAIGGSEDGKYMDRDDAYSTTVIDCEPPSGPGTGTPGYWKNHPGAWPVDEIQIGGVTYPRALAIELMGSPEKGDKTFTIFRALVAAELNVLIDNDSSCIADVISAAHNWLATYGPVGEGVKADSDAWQDPGEGLYEQLDAYNNGKLCAEARD